jgi:hypothetical protein
MVPVYKTKSKGRNLELSMSAQRDKHERAEHGVRGRVTACRQRLRRARASAQKPPEALGSADSAGAEDLLQTDSTYFGDDEFAGVMRKANGDLRWSERRRLSRG